MVILTTLCMVCLKGAEQSLEFSPQGKKLISEWMSTKFIKVITIHTLNHYAIYSKFLQQYMSCASQ